MYLNRIRELPKAAQQTLTPAPRRSYDSKEPQIFKSLDASTLRYKPYSLWDYRAIRPRRYLELGGLGPGVIGTENWQVARNKWQRMKKYAEVFKIDHSR